MEWKYLLNPNRCGDTASALSDNEVRSDFQRDYDRIIFSTAFRRLQNKTQVFPLPETDFIHTRLTHSLEASCVGRSLGKTAAMKIMHQFPGDFKQLPVTADDMASIVSAACLAHDIGNPPFGHSGEDAISEYFLSNSEILTELTDKQRYDLTHFEGNANGFRVLTYTDPRQSQIQGGLQLTFATLGAYSKYPKEATPCLSDHSLASEKKYGFFQSERSVFHQVAEQLRLLPNQACDDYRWKRHPLAFLVEAADDICYLIMDLEDGFKLKLVSFEEAMEELMPIINWNTSSSKRMDAILDTHEKLGYLRAKAINALINQTADTFTENYRDIMAGDFDKPLTQLIPNAEAIASIRTKSRQQVYSHQPAVEIETAGFEIIYGLLDAFLNATFKTGSKRYNKFSQLLPPMLRNRKLPLENKYETIIEIVHYIAGMTDNHALNTYRTIKGISLPRY